MRRVLSTFAVAALIAGPGEAEATDRRAQDAGPATATIQSTWQLLSQDLVEAEAEVETEIELEGEVEAEVEIEVESELGFESEVEAESELDAASTSEARAASPSAERPSSKPWWKPTNVEFYGNIELEGTGFVQEPLFTEQTRDNASISARPSLLMEWAEGDVAFTLTPFARIDSADARRRHWDLREAKIDIRRGDWAATLGADFVFWGRTEALKLVDIINSTDGVEDIDGEDKLGQPMLRVSYLSSGYGAFSAYWLPYFREPTFAGEEGRLRPGLQIADQNPRYGSSDEEWTQSFALRWEHVIGQFDFGLSGFYGLSRDPAFEPIAFAPIPTPPFAAPTRIRPVYDEIAQIGFDGQFTSGPALWKLEAIGRFNQLDRNLRNRDYFAVTGGIEYTLYGFLGGAGDLGLILEGAWDSRGQDALTNLEEDVVYGLRYGFNDDKDTSVLFFGATDVVSGGTALRLEAERRIFASWKLAMEGQGVVSAHAEDLEYDLRRDSYMRLKLSYFW